MKVDEGAQDLEGGNLVTTVPTIGVDLEELKIKNVTVKVWDLSG